MNKKAKAAVKTSILHLVVAAIVGAATLLGLVVTINAMTQFYNRPEQSIQVEVAGKRIRKYSSGKHASRVTVYSNIVAFSFPDGSLKELEIDTGPSSSVYNSIHEGDTGVLIYKELKNIEKKYKDEAFRYVGRFFH